MRFALALLITAASSLYSQTAPYIESFEVRVNNVDVIVTDRAGNRVTGLREEDFEVRENGAGGHELLGVSATIGECGARRNTIMPLTVAVPISSLTLLPDGKNYRGRFRIHYATAAREHSPPASRRADRGDRRYRSLTLAQGRHDGTTTGR